MSRSIRVLHIDDAETDRELVRDTLEQEHAGFELVQTASRDEFEACLAGAEYDLVLTDFNILSFEGLDVIDRVREVSPDVPVIVVTGTGSEAIAVEAMKRGAADYVIKTHAHIRRLPHTIGAVLDEARMRAEHRRTEETLQDSELKFRLLADYTYDWEYWIDPDGNYIYLSPSCERITGYSPDSFRERSDLLFEIVDPVHQERVRTHYHEANKEHPEFVGLEFPILRRDGEEIWIEHHCGPVFDENGKYIGRRGNNRDITVRKRAEEAVRQSAELIAKSQEIAHVGSWELDPRANRLTWSDEVYRMFGLRPEQFSGTLEEFREIVHPDDRATVDAAYAGSVSEGRDFYEIEHRIVRADTGEVRVVHEKCEHIRDSSGEVVRSIGMVQDITEEVRREEQYRQALKMESIGRLAGGVAHDFNNMLGVILGHTELAMEQVDPAGPLSSNLHEIRKAAERSADLTRQLLAFARKQTIAPKVLDLSETVEGMLTMLRRLIGEDIHLAWLPASGAWPILVDPSQVDQLVANLCVNARDAISGVGEVTIETGNSTFDEAYCTDHPGYVPGEYVQLAVSDDGCGMDRETIASLFEPFFSTKEMGTGLGLATAYGIVKQNNGFINVYSEPGEGTTFRIYLPRHTGGAAPVREDRPKTADIRGSETILLVEDEEAILELTTMMLESRGYAVLAAATPGEAIRLAEEHTGEIQLLITDVVMPQMHGRDLAQELQSLSPGLKCLFMSGYTADVITQRGVIEEGVNFIQKPFSIRYLTVKVRETLDGE